MAKIEQMDTLVMNLGTGYKYMRVYSAIAFGVQSFHVFNSTDEEVYTGNSIAEIDKWYWLENSVHFSSWGEVIETFHANGTNMYIKDQRWVYLESVYLCKMFELAYYMENSESPTLEGFLESNED